MICNLYQEACDLLKQHDIKISTARFACDAYGYIELAKFSDIAKNIYYDTEADHLIVDPTIKIVGMFWWLERKGEVGNDGWVFRKKPQRPTLPSVGVTLVISKNEEEYTQKNGL